LIDVNACHANVMNCFMMLRMTNVRWVTSKQDFYVRYFFWKSWAEETRW